MKKLFWRVKSTLLRQMLKAISRRIKKMYQDVYFEIMTTTNLWLCVKTGILQMHFTKCIVKYKYVFQRKCNCKTVSKISEDPLEHCFDHKYISLFTGDIYLFDVYNRNTRTRFGICSKLTIKTPTTTTPLASFWCLYFYLWTHFIPCSSVTFVQFEYVIAGWVRGNTQQI